MKKNKDFFFVFIAAILVGVLISINFDFNGIQSYSQLNTSEYQNAVEERARLYKEIGNLKESNIETNEKITNYTQNDKKNYKIIEDMKEQIIDYEMFTGLTEVEGSGIVLTLNDGTTNVEEENIDEVMSKLFHDNDMALILNELRQAGAEAICVNNHRVVPWSGAVCAWAFIQFEDGSMESAPFKIYAIGDPEKLKAALLEEGSHIKKLIFRKLFIDIEEREKITMPATNQSNNIVYMKRDENIK